MKKQLFILTALFCWSVCGTSLYAAEATPLEGIALSAASKAARSDIPFYLTVSSDGQMTTKPGEIFTQGGNYSGMELPYLLSTPEPIRYPRWAVREGWEGEFVIAIEVLKNGSTGRYKIMKSTGHKRLDEAAVRAVQSWKFHPAVKNGKIVVTCVELPITFTLNS